MVITTLLPEVLEILEFLAPVDFVVCCARLEEHVRSRTREGGFLHDYEGIFEK